jgi:hypothetical protein|mmetsp:Transcript_99711/g.157827  ORF Transcript_99711/g.157827 Transcript_99711/m.157827 type:complete len:326 (+) Transcript_99711:109-1086(+)
MKLSFTICWASLAHLVQPLKFLGRDALAQQPEVTGGVAQELKEMLARFRAADVEYGFQLPPENAAELADGMLPPLRSNSTFTIAGPGGDPALAIATGTGGGDYFTKMFTSENIADPKRGSGGCTAWRSTLKCNPSGIRDPLRDKTCDKVIGIDESGFCECGQYAQFAAVGCSHRPFTCETMCLKFALVSHKQAYYKGQALTPEQADATVKYLMWANQTDLESMRIMTNELVHFMNRAMQYTTESGKMATESLQKFEEMMKHARTQDANKAAQEMERYRKQLAESPWLGIWRSGQDMVNAGQGIQAMVKDVVPFEPQAALNSKAVH